MPFSCFSSGCLPRRTNTEFVITRDSQPSREDSEVLHRAHNETNHGVLTRQPSRLGAGGIGLIDVRRKASSSTKVAAAGAAEARAEELHELREELLDAQELAQALILQNDNLMSDGDELRQVIGILRRRYECDRS